MSIRDENLASASDPSGMGGPNSTGSLLIIKASVLSVRAEPDKMWYPACPTVNGERTCNKKLSDQGGGTWVCNTCGNVPGPVFRYILSVQLVDATGANFVTAFDAEAQQLLGKSAAEMHEFVETVGGAGNPCPNFDAVIKDAGVKEMLFTVRVKMELVRDENRIKGTVIKVRSLDYAKESRVLLEAIKKYPPPAA